VNRGDSLRRKSRLGSCFSECRAGVLEKRTSVLVISVGSAQWYLRLKQEGNCDCGGQKPSLDQDFLCRIIQYPDSLACSRFKCEVVRLQTNPTVTCNSLSIHRTVLSVIYCQLSWFVPVPHNYLHEMNNQQALVMQCHVPWYLLTPNWRDKVQKHKDQKCKWAVDIPPTVGGCIQFVFIDHTEMVFLVLHNQASSGIHFWVVSFQKK
jgi:hypothetical protein